MNTAIEIESAVRKLNAYYCDAVMRRDGELWRSLWHTDARWFFLGEWIEGREAIFSRWQQAMAGFPVVYHRASGEIIDVNGEAAHTRVYVDEQIIDAKGNALHIVGVYNDDVVLHNGKWLYASRHFSLIYQGEGTLVQEGWLGYS
jgi:hypothetical protein